jgi:hypothetical protein
MFLRLVNEELILGAFDHPGNDGAGPKETTKSDARGGKGEVDATATSTPKGGSKEPTRGAFSIQHKSIIFYVFIV